MNYLKSAIYDNHKRGCLGDFLKEKISTNASLSIVSAYFTIYAYEKLKKELDGINELNFLFGEPTFIRNVDHDKNKAKHFGFTDKSIELSNQLAQKYIAKECATWIERKVNIRSIKQSNLLHGKMYHIQPENSEDSAIIGSSNFTTRGLGLCNNQNIELNLNVDGGRDRKDLKSWFDEIWNNEEFTEDVKEKVLHCIKQIYINHSPKFVYFKTLFHIFAKFLEEQEEEDNLIIQTHLIDTKIWNMLFPFQKEGAKSAINKINKHNGCIIADSVGLGKTFEALAVIKYFRLRGERVLVLCPKKLERNWTVHKHSNNSKVSPLIEDNFDYTVLAHTDLTRENGTKGDVNFADFNWGNYGLVVIDESHNFRNAIKGKEKDGVYKKSRYEKLLEDVIKSGKKTKVLLLSATPVNNDLKDLRNQISIITADNDNAFSETLEIHSLKELIALSQRNFTNWVKNRTGSLHSRLPSDLFHLLDELTIARSRRHIEEYYSESMEEIGKFPERLKPISIYSHIDIKNDFLSFDTVNDDISNYKLSLFQPSNYVKPEHKDKYHISDSNKDFNNQANREYFLIGMMKVGFLKRLESSIYSFALTLKRTIEKIRNLEEKLNEFREKFASQGDFGFENDEELQSYGELFDEKELEAFEVGKKLKYSVAHLHVEEWLTDLRKDRDNLKKLYLAAKEVTPERDAKLAELKELIKNKLNNPSINKNGKEVRKVIVFTAYADTAKYLHDNIADWVKKEYSVYSGLVCGGGDTKANLHKPDFDSILVNFSPISKQRDKIETFPQNEEIDILIATDCISEGQNLQDCDYLINYDIHWNPVRIIQRFGRIDRIGSLNNEIQLVNFWATANLDKYIGLKERVEARMKLVDITATQDDNILEEEKELVQEEELAFRDKQLLRLMEEVLDMDDFNEGSISFADFTLDDFRADLMNYLEINKRLLEETPLGIYTVVPYFIGSEVIKEGVIFCLKQNNDISERDKINPLKPYFLVYIREDGEVRYNFTSPKQILDIYRKLCINKESAYEELCDLFDIEIDDGKDLSFYNSLIEKACKAVMNKFDDNMIKNLQTSRNAVIVEDRAETYDDFELVTWLVIKEEK